MTTPIKTVSLVWVGPEGHYWPHVDQTLVAGQRYQVEESLAREIVKASPDHWQRPAQPKAQANAPTTGGKE
jgi:hypothetical protein